MAAELDNEPAETWIQNSLLLVQASVSPLICSASDVFQARKVLLVGTIAIAFVGAAIAPGAHSIGRLIAAQALIGMGFTSLPLGYSVPSEIVPRRWRPREYSMPAPLRFMFTEAADYVISQSCKPG